MQAALGPPADAGLVESLARAQADAFVQAIGSAIGGRRDRLRLIGAYLQAVSACQANPFRVTDIASAAPAGSKVTVKQFRHLLDDAAWDESALRRSLVASIPMSSVEAFVLECWPVLTDPVHDRGYDIFAVTAVGEGFAVPLGWRRASVPPADPAPGSPVREISEEEHRCVHELLTELGDDYVAVAGELPPRVPPILALDQRFGENHDLRGALEVPEYFLTVGPEYEGLELAAEAYEMRRPGQIIARQFGEWPDDAPAPVPKQVLGASSRRTAEYAVAFRAAGLTRYAVARPLVRAPRGAMLGRRPQVRARALAELAARLPQWHSGTNDRVVAFRHHSERGWLRHALLLSAAQAVVSGRLQGSPPTSSKPTP